MRRALLAIVFGLATISSASADTSFNISVETAGSITPFASDTIAHMVGVDTHFGANSPYTNVSAVKAALDASNLHHVRDGSPGALPAAIGNGVALGLDISNPYNIGGNGAFSETAATVAKKIAEAPNGDYIELCGNEQDNDSRTKDAGAQWPTMLAGCVVSEVGFINAYYNAHPNARRLPIAAPSIEDLNHAPLLGQALGSNRSLIDFANFHPGTGALNPAASESCMKSDTDSHGFLQCAVKYASQSLATVAATYAKLISKNGAYLVTEWGFSDRKNTAYDSSGHVSGHIYNRVNGLPEAMLVAFDVRSILEWANGGASRMYFYQFADVPTDCTFGAQGLVTADISNLPGGHSFQDDDCTGDYQFSNTVTHKPEFYAVNNLIGLFADSAGSSDVPAPIAAKITISSANVHRLIARKHDGTVLVALWREEDDYDWVGAQYCASGASVVSPVVDYPATNHRYGCKVTNESASVSISGYSASKLDVFQADGSIKSTSTVPSTIPLTTPYPTILELEPS